MKNYLGPATPVTLPAPATTKSGDFVRVGSVYGFAGADAASGADVSIFTKGQFLAAKATGETWAIGDQLYWDATNHKFTKTSTSNVAVNACAIAVAGSADTTGKILLDGTSIGTV